MDPSLDGSRNRKIALAIDERRNISDRTILLINLDAMGDVLMTTCMLEPLRRLHPDALLTWVTLPGHMPLLESNPLIDRVWPYTFETVSVLEMMEFDLLLNVDKGRPSCALATKLSVGEKRGFGLNRSGALIPLNEEAGHLCRLGVGEEHPVIGIQTGSSDLYRLKSLTVDQVVELITRIRKWIPDSLILLLGEPAEGERNETIADRCPGMVIKTPTDEGLRCGTLSIDACDILVSPDTGALYIGIALAKWCVGWFSLSCAQEIDRFDHGVKVTTPLGCSPCWRRECPDPICLPMADLDAIVDGVSQGVEALRPDATTG